MWTVAHIQAHQRLSKVLFQAVEEIWVSQNQITLPATHMHTYIHTHANTKPFHPYTPHKTVSPIYRTCPQGEDPDDAFSSVPYEKGLNLLYALEQMVRLACLEIRPRPACLEMRL